MPFIRVYIHFVWHTVGSLPLIEDDIEESVYAIILNKCKELKCEPLAVGGTSNHVHLLVRMASMVSMGQLVGQVKGVSSRLVNTKFPNRETALKWQGSYGAFSVRMEELEHVGRYIHSQKEHHRCGTLEEQLEQTEAEESEPGLL